MVVVLLPDSGRGYLSKIFDDDWMVRFGFLQMPGTTAGDVVAAKDARIAELVVVIPEQMARDAVATMRQLGVSQLVVATTTEQPLAAKEISGTISELPLMEKAFHDPTVLERPVGEVMEPALPMVGIGETVSDVVDRLQNCSAVLVLAGGHPVGILTRQDVLTFLAGRGPA
jgi:cystathionine beta-synthase